MNFGILLLRLTIGLLMQAHGAQKLFGWFGGYGLDGTGRYMETIGFLPGRRAALLAGLAELVGGLLLAAGLFTPVGAALVAAVVVVAAATAHLGKGLFIQNGGYEYTLVLALAALALAFTGPGSFSLDALLGLERSGLGWGLGATVVALAGAGIQLAARHQPSTTTQRS